MKIKENQWAHICVASVCALLLIWVLPNTIALRHILLGVGCLSGAFLIKENWKSFYPLKVNLIPLYAITSLFIWVGIHYCFFSLNQPLELMEIKGLWVRTFAGFIMAIGLGISLSQHHHLRKYFYISIFFVPIINMLAYLYACYLHGGFVKPNDFVFFLFAKIETAYFGALAAAIGVANLIYLITRKSDKTDYFQIALYLLGLLLVLTSALVSSTKNGIAISMALCILLAFILLINSLLNSKAQKRVSFIALLFVFLIFGVIWKGHQSFAGKGWDTVVADAKVGFDIDSTNEWRMLNGTSFEPKNSYGKPVALNTYYRAAFISSGLRFIKKYPFGYGSINQSYNLLQDLDGEFHKHTGQVHSGWIDFGLAFGIPGLLLMFTSLLGVIYFAISHLDRLNLASLLICVMLIPFCLIAEMGYKQYFESWIFMMTFSATVVALSAGKKSN